MALASVSWNGTRIDAASGTSSTTNIGGGAGAGIEPDIRYQGNEDISRKVGTSAGGFWIDTASTDISSGSGTYQTVLMKIGIGNWAALELLSVPGVEVRLGSSTAAYANYNVAGSDTYPEKGGFVFYAIDPNIAGYRSGTNGSPNFASAAEFAVVGDFTATSKGENVVMSAVDVGNGYTVTGGGGGDPTADYAAIASFNSTIANRHGFLFALEGQDGAYGQFGKVVWGSSGAAVDYQDNSAPTVFLLDGRFAAGWSGITDNVENASTIIAPIGGSFISRGNTTTTDTRGVYNAIGAAAAGSRTGQTFVNFAQFNCGSTFTYEACDIQTADFAHNTATLTDCTLRSTAASGVALCNDFTPADASGLVVVQNGAGHFVDLGTIAASQTITWDVSTVGFAAGSTGDPVTTTTAGDEVILVNVAAGQKLTISVADGATVPSVKNDGSGTVAVVAGQVTVTFEGLATGGEFRIYDDDGDGNQITLGTNREGVETLAATTYALTHSTAEAGNVVYAQFMHPGVFEEEVQRVVLGIADQTITFNLIPEENA